MITTLTHPKITELPRRPGTYLLLLGGAEKQRVRIGRCGDLPLQPGCYLYVGSALGPGGIRARVGRHLTVVKRPHWHIDHLRAATRIEEVWYSSAPHRQEHRWARALAQLPGVTLPLPRFGASDCCCPSHLFHLPTTPDFARISPILQEVGITNSPRQSCT